MVTFDLLPEPGATLVRAMVSACAFCTGGTLGRRSSGRELLVSSPRSCTVDVVESVVSALDIAIVAGGNAMMAVGMDGFSFNNQRRCSSRLLRVIEGEHCCPSFGEILNTAALGIAGDDVWDGVMLRRGASRSRQGPSGKARFSLI